MPIANLDRRLRELGRIRMGDRAPTGNRRPRKLETWRLTSPTRHLLDAAAVRYGGEVRPWQDAPTGTGNQWELYTDADALNVAVPPDAALTQWLEHWSGGGCQRRCDGIREQRSDRPCLCADEVETGGQRTCQPSTRLNVLLPDLPDLGVWRLESHGYYAAVELAGMVAFLARFAEMLPVRLVITRRQIKRPGEPARQFVVPALELVAPLAEIAARTGRSPFTLTYEAKALPALEGVDTASGEILDGPAGDGGPAVSPPPSPAAFPRDSALMRAAQQEGTVIRRSVEQSAAGTAPGQGATGQPAADPLSGAGEREPVVVDGRHGGVDGEGAGTDRDDPAPDSTSPPAGEDSADRSGEASTRPVPVRDLATARQLDHNKALLELRRHGLSVTAVGDKLGGAMLARARELLDALTKEAAS
jgi:hypothetical protein